MAEEPEGIVKRARGVEWTETPMFDLPVVDTSMESVSKVFERWVSVHRPKSKVRCVLTDKRARKIRQALKDFGLQTCLDAIDGCALSEFHMGENSRGKKYDDIELILRDAPHVERFAMLAIEARERASRGDNVIDMQRWAR